MKTLISRAAVFLGEGDLMDEFKEVLGYDPKQDDVENGPPGSIRTGPPEALAAQPSDDGQGPSYRKLPWSVSHSFLVFLLFLYPLNLSGGAPCLFRPR